MEKRQEVECFDQIYAQTREAVLTQITAKCGNPADIQDIFQDTYTEVFTIICRKGIDYIKQPEAFVRQVARQKIYRYYRLADRLKSLFLWPKAAGADEDEPDMTELAIDTFEIEDWLDQKDMSRKIETFLAERPAEIQKIFYLFYSREMRIAEIAELMEISQSNVKNKLYRTIKEMRKQYHTAEKEEVSGYEGKSAD